MTGGQLMKNSFAKNKLRNKKRQGRVVARLNDFAIIIPQNDVLLKTEMVESFMYENLDCSEEEAQLIVKLLSNLT